VELRLMSNTISTISPYKFNGQWVFDDPTHGLVREAFVADADTIIDGLLRQYNIRKGGERGFILLFSSEPFPGFQTVLSWRRAEMTGNWYHSSALDMDGWLCASLLKYFDSPPPQIYVQLKSKETE
jgi:hypothetical protein